MRLTRDPGLGLLHCLSSSLAYNLCGDPPSFPPAGGGENFDEVYCTVLLTIVRTNRLFSVIGLLLPSTLCQTMSFQPNTAKRLVQDMPPPGGFPTVSTCNEVETVNFTVFYKLMRSLSSDCLRSIYVYIFEYQTRRCGSWDLTVHAPYTPLFCLFLCAPGTGIG